MGWWAPTILGGDEPFDLIDDLTELLGLSPEDKWFNPTEETKKAVMSFGVARYEEFIRNSAPFSSCVAAHVVALVHMGAGVPLPPELCKLALEACKDVPHGWNDPTGRKARLDEFADIIRRYVDNAIPPLRKQHFELMLGV